MATETIHTYPPTPQRSFLDQTIDLARLNWEVAAYVLLVALSVIAHLWNLGGMALHHDESIHAWMSWKFYTGNGGFTCWNNVASDVYCYDPVYHGPALYILTALAYFLFGDGDAQARLPMAVAGIGMVASCWMLRPYLGRRGAFIAAVLLGFSPSLLYYTRFARHDGLMVLWELWMIIGIFRYLDTGKPGYLYLLAASLALAVGTHELYYILFFIFGIIVLARLIFESSYSRYLNIGFAVVVGLSAVLTLASSVFYLRLPIGEGLYIGEKTFLIGITVLLTWLAARLWLRSPVLLPRLRTLWETERTTLWIALGILVGLYLVMYTTFFAYPPGAIDGLYAGLAYWLGSQQEYARGDQPWYYYFMLIAVYEPLGLLCSIGAAIALFSDRGRTFIRLWRRLRGQQIDEPLPEVAATTEPAPAQERRRRRAARQEQHVDDPAALPTIAAVTLDASTPAPSAATPPTGLPTGNLFPLVMVVWYFSAIVIFSWAGEKMPWLVTHMALPGNLVAAWVLSQLLGAIPPLQRGAALATEQPATGEGNWRLWLVPPALILLIVALMVAFVRLGTDAAGQAAQINLLQGLIPLIIVGFLIYGLLTLSQQIGTRVVLAVGTLTLAAVLGAYMIRATWLAVYTHPDVPIELLVYTQTSPDVPRYVEEVRKLAINQTRNYRTAEDEAGGLAMPVVVSNGDEGGDGSLAWPLQWYFREFQRVLWKSGEDIRDPTMETFETELPDGTTGLAPVLMLFSPQVTEATRSFLEQHYVQPYGSGGVFNWWFPEGEKCAPDSPGYKRFYFNWLTSREMIHEPPPEGCTNADAIADQIHGPLTPFIWPFLPENRESMTQFMLFRELPDPLQPGSRDMEVWIRSDLVSGVPADQATGSATGASSAPLRLVAQQALGEPGDFNAPTNVVVDSQGRVYVADTMNHQIKVFNEAGELVDTIGELGSGEGQFNEPRGLAIDGENNLYVADTWNARIIKLSPQGRWLATWGSGSNDMGNGRVATITDGSEEQNAANPLGFFGPRGLAVDDAGNVYIADTGNKRIVVTNTDGEYQYQWGSLGSEPGDFNEPTGIAVDAQNRLYVADTWNGRVQVFERGPDNRVSSLPMTTWRVSGWNPNTYDDPSIAASPAGQVYVSIPARQQVAAFSFLGDMLLRWGGTGQDLASLNAPSGMAVAPDGSVYIVDRSVGRVLRFQLPQVQPNS